MNAVTPPGEAQQPYLLIDYQWHESVIGTLRDELAAVARLARTYTLEHPLHHYTNRVLA
jgi:hypothetical protein